MSGEKKVLTAEQIQKDFKNTWCRKNLTLEYLPTNKKFCVKIDQLNLEKIPQKIIPIYQEVY